MAHATACSNQSMLLPVFRELHRMQAHFAADGEGHLGRHACHISMPPHPSSFGSCFPAVFPAMYCKCIAEQERDTVEVMSRLTAWLPDKLRAAAGWAALGIAVRSMTVAGAAQQPRPTYQGSACTTSMTPSGCNFEYSRR